MIRNVICSQCGKIAYNPYVPVKHVIDTCNNDKCLLSRESVIGFKNGNIRDCHFENLYYVSINAYLKEPIDNHDVTSEQIKFNNLVALMIYYRHNKDFDSLQKVINDSIVSESPEADYYRSMIYFSKLNNIAKGVKHLKLSAEKFYPPAMAEFGYIIIKGLYDTPKQVDKGFEYLIKSADLKEPLAGVYLDMLFKDGLCKGKRYEEISKDDWNKYILLGKYHSD
jgi:hypothetical protein